MLTGFHIGEKVSGYMHLIVNSLLLAPLVASRMLLPLIGIFLASAVVWPIANLFTLGYADYISEAATNAFITMFGIRAALALKGDNRFVELVPLATYSVAFGVVLSVVKTVCMLAALAVIIMVADVPFTSSGLSFQTLNSAEEVAQSAFDQVGLPWNILILVPFLIIAPVVFAVPMAAIAQSCGRGAYSQGIFWGIGKSFLPLFVIFLVSLALQLYFGFFTLIFVMLPTLIFGLLSLVNSPESFTFDLEGILKGLFYFAGFLSAQAWLWSAAALALLKAQDRAQAASANHVAVETAPVDLRSLRKSRELRHH